MHAGVLHLGRQGRIDGDAAIGRERDKALREIDIARRQCSADFVLRHIPIEAAIERLIADPDRIVGCSEPVTRGDAFANKRKRDQGKKDGADERKSRMPCQPKELPLAHRFVPWPCASSNPRSMSAICGFFTTNRDPNPFAGNQVGGPLWCGATSRAG